MDEHQLFTLINRCNHLKYKFAGVYAANNFPALSNNTFYIVNASIAGTYGSHWTLFCMRNSHVFFADPLGFKLENYVHIYSRSIQLYSIVRDVSFQLQPFDSNQCGPYCIFLAHLIFNGTYMALIGPAQLNRFVNHML